MAIFSKRDFQIRTFVVTQKNVHLLQDYIITTYMYSYYFLESDGNNTKILNVQIDQKKQETEGIC